MAQAPIKCDLCGSFDAVRHYCVNCCETLCERCKTAHANGKKTRNDTIIPLSQTRIERFNKSSTDVCDMHSTEKTRYCETCSIVLCMTCVDKNHENHKVIILTDKELKKIKTLELQNVIALLNDKKTLYTNVFDIETDRHRQYLESIEKCKTDIGNKKSRMIDKFLKEMDSACDSHFLELSILQETERKRYADICQTILAKKQAVTSMKQTVKNALESGESTTMIKVSTEATQALYGFEDPTPTLLPTPVFKTDEIKEHTVFIGSLFTHMDGN